MNKIDKLQFKKQKAGIWKGVNSSSLLKNVSNTNKTFLPVSFHRFYGTSKRFFTNFKKGIR